MANPHGRSWDEIHKEEKRLGITPEEGATKKQRSRRITERKNNLGEKARLRGLRYRKKNPEKLKARDQARVRGPAERARSVDRSKKKWVLTKAARAKPPSRRTAREKELVKIYERELERKRVERVALSKVKKADRDAWRKSLSAKDKEKEALKAANAILREAKARSRREYTVDVVGKGGRKRKVKKVAYAMSLHPEDWDKMLDDLYKNQLKWFKEGGVLPDWDHIIAEKAKDLNEVRVASGLTNPFNMKFLDPYTNRGVKSNWLSPQLLKRIEKAQMRFIKSKGLMNPMAWPTMLAGMGLLAFSPEESKASMVGEGLVAASDPLTTVLSGPRLNRPREYTTEGGWRNQLGDPTFRQKKYTIWD